LAVDGEDEFPLHDLEMLIVGGVEVLRRSRVSWREDTDTTLELPARVLRPDKAKNPFPGYRLRIDRGGSLGDKRCQTPIAVILKPRPIDRMAVSAKLASRDHLCHCGAPCLLAQSFGSDLGCTEVIPCGFLLTNLRRSAIIHSRLPIKKSQVGISHGQTATLP
jgi:hypothetical protein